MTLAALAFAGVLSFQARSAKAADLTPGAVVLLANKTDAAGAAAVRRALAHPDPLIRRAAGRVAAVNHPELVDAVQQALQVESDPEVSAELVRDMLAMAGASALPIVDGAARRDRAAFALAEWFARMDATGFVSHLPAWAALPRSEDELMHIVRLAIQRHPDARDAILSAWRGVASARAIAFAESTAIDSGEEPLLMTPPIFAARLLASTLTAAGCGTKKGFAVAVVTFKPDGRPRSVDAQRDLNDACRTALIAIATVSIADEADAARGPRQLIIPFAKEFIACAASLAGTPLLTTGIAREGVRDPRLIKERKPYYTPQAMEAKLEGIVEYDAVISAGGCVASARETRGLKPSSGLDFQALVAMLQWQFDPARWGDTPVPSVVSIELTFTLR